MIGYRGYWIERDPKPGSPGTCPDCRGTGCRVCGGSGRCHLHDYDFVHEAYDGPGDPRHGTAHSMSAARRRIDELVEEYGDSE